jgi:NlpC/P60 family
MQFLEPAFADVLGRHALPPGGATPALALQPARRSPRCSLLPVRFRAPQDLYKAIFAYNHADWYVRDVLAQARKYSETRPNVSLACPIFQPTFQSGGQHFSSDRALVAVRFACAQLGKPYVWGGDGDPGFDCSGLTKAAYPQLGSFCRVRRRRSRCRAASFRRCARAGGGSGVLRTAGRDSPRRYRAGHWHVDGSTHLPGGGSSSAGLAWLRGPGRFLSTGRIGYRLGPSRRAD